LAGAALSIAAPLPSGASISGRIRTAQSSVMAHHMIHHDPGPKPCSTNGAISPDEIMPSPGPA
jgi:hypothetical protein